MHIHIHMPHAYAQATPPSRIPWLDAQNPPCPPLTPLSSQVSFITRTLMLTRTLLAGHMVTIIIFFIAHMLALYHAFGGTLRTFSTPFDALNTMFSLVLGEFDPLNLLEGKSKLEVYKYREAELTHGRVAMLASLGFLVQEFYHPLFSPEITNVAINQIPELPPVFWFALTLGISAAEITRIQLGFANPYEANVKGKKGARDEVKGTLKEGYYPGDLRFDPLNIKPTTPDAFRQMQERELSHGRLAMFAAAGFIAQETVDQEPWGFFWGINDAWNAF